MHKEMTVEEAVKLAQQMASDQDLKLLVVENMERYAGSFVKSMANCFRHADQINTYKLACTFIRYVVEYHPDNWRK